MFAWLTDPGSWNSPSDTIRIRNPQKVLVVEHLMANPDYAFVIVGHRSQ
jgi:hypothetical protein